MLYLFLYSAPSRSVSHPHICPSARKEKIRLPFFPPIRWYKQLVPRGPPHLFARHFRFQGCAYFPYGWFHLHLVAALSLSFSLIFSLSTSFFRVSARSSPRWRRVTQSPSELKTGPFGVLPEREKSNMSRSQSDLLPQYAIATTTDCSSPSTSSTWRRRWNSAFVSDSLSLFLTHAPSSAHLHKL